MKKTFFLAAMAAATIVACTPKSEPQETSVLLTENIRFCEATLLTPDGKVLVGSFGTEELNPLNNEGKGYILEFTDTVSRVLIPNDGTLSAPKGMLIKDNYLFIADVGKMAVYNLADSVIGAPKVVPFPEGELFVNDMALHGNTLYVTVTNTGSIYSLDVSTPAQLDTAGLKPYITIPGANGIVIRNDTMYIASYPPDGTTTPDNVIYYIDNISTPVANKLFDRPGQYDGLALSEDGQRLYFTNWVGPEIGYYDLSTRSVELLDPGTQLMGPARISLKGDTLYIPDLPNSKVVVLKIKK